ncbi:DNA methylase [Vibrio phage 1.187.O._10N.286.49.F1]|nr:DNA methylase [Vibrio phage 1.187.O._10N.286.49.F1]
MIITKDNGTIHTLVNSNFLEVEGLPTFDMVLTDPPFATTQAKWDTPLDLPETWKWIGDVTHERTPILLFAQTPFDKVLGVSNIRKLKYEWIWEKTSATGHLNAKKMPMKCHENVLVFYDKLPLYTPQKTTGHVRKTAFKGSHLQSELYNKVTNNTTYDSTERYPRDVLKFASDKQKLNLHSTQKPLELLRYMIRTYTNEGDTILDFTAGSCSLAVAAIHIQKGWDEGWYKESYHERCFKAKAK